VRPYPYCHPSKPLTLTPLYHHSCIQPSRAKFAQSIRIDWDLPGIAGSVSESVIDRFNRITDASLNLYKGAKFNAPLNSVIFSALTCSGGNGFESGVDDLSTSFTGKTSYSRSNCLSLLNDFESSSRTKLTLTQSDILDTSQNPQRFSLPSSTSP
jgi:hypothetical protein